MKYINNRNCFLGCYNSKIVSDFWIKKNLSDKMYFLTNNSKLNAKYLLKKYGNPLKFSNIEKNWWYIMPKIIKFSKSYKNIIKVKSDFYNNNINNLKNAIKI